MQAEEVAMFLTSTPRLLNRPEKWASRQAGIRPLRRTAPVSGINNTAEASKHTMLAVGRWMLYGWERVIPEAQLQLIHSPSLTLLASHRLSLEDTCSVQVLSLTSLNTDPLIYICLTDLCHSQCWRIICRVVRSLICIGSSSSWHFSWTSLTSSSPLWASTCFTAQLDES